MLVCTSNLSLNSYNSLTCLWCRFRRISCNVFVQYVGVIDNLWCDGRLYWEWNHIKPDKTFKTVMCWYIFMKNAMSCLSKYSCPLTDSSLIIMSDCPCPFQFLEGHSNVKVQQCLISWFNFIILFTILLHSILIPGGWRHMVCLLTVLGLQSLVLHHAEQGDGRGRGCQVIR